MDHPTKKKKKSLCNSNTVQTAGFLPERARTENKNTKSVDGAETCFLLQFTDLKPLRWSAVTLRAQTEGKRQISAQRLMKHK